MSANKLHTDRLLLIELRRGNEKAFRKLFELFWEPMFVTAKSIVLDADVAKDIVQNVWTEIWQQREAREIRNFKAYTYKAVKNGCYKYFRDNKFSATHLRVIEALELTIQPETEKRNDLEETEIVIQKSLKELPQRCQQIFILSRVEDISNEEIASILGISKRSVENQMSIALRSIRKNLTLGKSAILSILFCLI